MQCGTEPSLIYKNTRDNGLQIPSDHELLQTVIQDLLTALMTKGLPGTLVCVHNG